MKKKVKKLKRKVKELDTDNEYLIKANRDLLLQLTHASEKLEAIALILRSPQEK